MRLSGHGHGPGPRIGVIVGPTACGKSTLAERLVERCDAEIISADALQVYRGLDIGTAKPSGEARARYRYHCIDLYAPDERSTAGTFALAARAAVADVLQRGRLPLLAGGSGFYIDATLGRLDPLPRSEPAWRVALETVSERRGVAVLHGWLGRLDPERAAAIDKQDRQRVLRALELVLRTGRSVASLGADIASPEQFDPVFVGLRWPREELYRRIDDRVDRMLASGWLGEVEDLLEHGVDRDLHAMQAIGYRDLCAVAASETTLDEARSKIARDTRRYAKRQMTYCRRWQMHWIDLVPGESSGDERVVRAAEALLLAAPGCHGLLVAGKANGRDNA